MESMEKSTCIDIHFKCERMSYLETSPMYGNPRSHVGSNHCRACNRR
jgi:hypothetical protein